MLGMYGGGTVSRPITKKLRLAAEILGDERLADDDEFILKLYRMGNISQKQVYKAVEHFGYRWYPNRGQWRLVLPRWLETAMKRRDRAIMDSWR